MEECKSFDMAFKAQVARIDQIVATLTQASDESDAKQEAIKAWRKEIINQQNRITSKKVKITNEQVEISNLKDVLFTEHQLATRN